MIQYVGWRAQFDPDTFIMGGGARQCCGEWVFHRFWLLLLTVRRRVRGRKRKKKESNLHLQLPICRLVLKMGHKLLMSEACGVCPPPPPLSPPPSGRSWLLSLGCACVRVHMTSLCIFNYDMEAVKGGGSCSFCFCLRESCLYARPQWLKCNVLPCFVPDSLFFLRMAFQPHK